MRTHVSNATYALLLFMPLIILASLPMWLLNTGQGGELLSNLWSDRTFGFLALIAFPFLFSMFAAASRIILNSADRLPFVPGRLSFHGLGKKGRILASSLAALFSVLASLLPLYTYQRDDFVSSLDNHGFVARRFYEIGICLLGMIGVGLYVQWRAGSNRGNRLLRFIFRPYIVYPASILPVYLGSIYLTPFNELDQYKQANAEAFLFFSAAVIVAWILPSLRIIRSIGGQEESPSKSLANVFFSEWRAAALATLILLSFAIAPARAGLLLGSLLVLVAGLGAWSIVGAIAWSALLLGRHRIPKLLSLTLGLGLLSLCTNHSLEADRVNISTRGYANDSAATPGHRIRVSEDYDMWNVETHIPNQPTIIVLAEGGGIRASYWTTEGLARIGLPAIDLMSRTYAIIGVSGGAIGTAAFMADYVAVERASRASPSDFPPPFNSSFFAGNLAGNALASDFLGPWLARVMSTEVIQKLIPIRFSASKGDALQSAWYASLTCERDNIWKSPAVTKMCAEAGPILDAPLADFPKILNDRTLPRLVFVSTHVESGERVLFSSVNYQESDFWGATLMETLSPRQTSLLSAAHASARFPIVSPPGEIFDAKGDSAGHVVDGGYDDNSGAQTALDIVRSISGGGSRDFHPIIVDLNNDPDEGASISEKRSGRRLGSEWMTAALTLATSRKSQGLLAKRELLRQACELGGGYVSLKVSRQRDGPIGLGWTLSERAKTSLMIAMSMETIFFSSAKPGMPTPALSMEELKKKAQNNCLPGA